MHKARFRAEALESRGAVDHLHRGGRAKDKAVGPPAGVGCSLGFRVQGLGVRVQGLGIGGGLPPCGSYCTTLKGLGFRVWQGIRLRRLRPG